MRNPGTSSPSSACSAATSVSNASGNAGPAGAFAALRGRRASPCVSSAIPDAPVRLDRHDRRRRVVRDELRAVDLDALRRGRVDHVQRDDDRHAEIEQLTREVEVAVEVGGIDDGEHDIGPRLLRPAAEEQIDGDHLVGAAGGEAVGARQVDQVDRDAAAR